MNNNLPHKIHFVGIGGIGMSGLAEFLHKEGHKITGSDLKKSENTKRLEKMGIEIFYNHNKKNVGDADLIVYSSAIPKSNPERQLKNVPVIKRAVMLNRVMQKRKYQIAISGMHGKTTTSSLLTHIFTEADYDPTALLGGILQNNQTNIRYGQGEYCIVEADEYDRSFMELYPSHGIITNIEPEHMDIYESLEDIKNTFTDFAIRVAQNHSVILCKDDENIHSILSAIPYYIGYGINQECEYQALQCSYQPGYSTFQLRIYGKKAGKVRLALPGQHNILNSLACIAMARECGIELDVIFKALDNYQGSRRRMEIKYEDEKYILIDDYAHHPTEIQVTLKALQKSYDRPVLAIFQPHLYSRTRSFYKDFAGVLKLAHQAIVTDIYPAREKPIPGVSSRLITNLDDNIKYCDKENLLDMILDVMEPGQIIITLGAGDINMIHTELINSISKYNN